MAKINLKDKKYRKYSQDFLNFLLEDDFDEYLNDYEKGDTDGDWSAEHDHFYEDFDKPEINFIINPESKVVTYLSDFEDPVVVKTHPEDDFDKYIGAALAYVYAEFGSKTQFRKFVDSHSKELKSREERKTFRSTNKIKGVTRKIQRTGQPQYYATDVKVEAFQKDQQGNYTLTFSTQPTATDSIVTRDGEQDFRYLIGKAPLKTRGRPTKKVSE